MSRFLTATLMLYSFLLILMNIARLPARVPTHFNGAGEPNGWGSPNTLWLILLAQVLTSGTFLIVSLLSRRFPGMVHFGSRKFGDLTSEQQTRIVPLLNDMSRCLSVASGVLFSYLIHEMIRAASSANPQAFLGWMLGLFFTSVAAIVIYYLRRIGGIADGEASGLRSAT